MKDILKAQLTIGFLAFFATVWSIVIQMQDQELEIPLGLSIIGAQFILLLILSFVIISILEWVQIFDLKTNSVLTLITLITIPIISQTI